MYDNRSNLIIGFHGCDKAAANALITDPDTIKISQEDWDWLGHGFYFWENNQERAWEWARARQRRKKLPENDAAVIGAVIQLGQCCDFMDSRFTNLLPTYHKLLEEAHKKKGTALPTNHDPHPNVNNDRILRVLDCQVIQFMHTYNESKYQQEVKATGYSTITRFDSVRGVFTEGGPVYDGAGIYAKSHIQICVRNFNCIKGFFLPRTEVEFVAVGGTKL